MKMQPFISADYSEIDKKLLLLNIFDSLQIILSQFPKQLHES